LRCLTYKKRIGISMPFSCTLRTLKSYIFTLVLRYSAVDTHIRTHTHTHTHIHIHAHSFFLSFFLCFSFIRFLLINHDDGCGRSRRNLIIMRKKCNNTELIIWLTICNIKMLINCSILWRSSFWMITSKKPFFLFSFSMRWPRTSQ